MRLDPNEQHVQEQEVRALLDRELAAAEERPILEHLAACPACNGRYGELLEAGELLPGLHLSRRPRHFPRAAAVLLAAAAAAAALLLLFPEEDLPVPPPAPPQAPQPAVVALEVTHRVRGPQGAAERRHTSFRSITQRSWRLTLPAGSLSRLTVRSETRSKSR